MLDRVRSILDINNSFFQFGRKLLYVFLLNVIFVITCIPVFTAGATMVAMNGVFMKIINERDFSLLKDYFRYFKESFVQATVVWLASLAVIFVLYVDIFYWAKYGTEEGVYGWFMLIFSSLAALFFLMMLHTVFPVISRFDMTFKELVKNTFLITVKDIFYCLEAVVFTVLIVGISVYMIISGKFLFMIYMALICFGLNGLVQSYIYRRVLNKYSEEYIEMVKRVREEMKKEGYYN